MTSFLYQIIYMLALLTAKRIEEVIVGTTAASSSSPLVSATTTTTTITTTTAISTISSSNNSDTAIVMNEFNNSNETEWIWQIEYQKQHKQQQQQQKQHQIEKQQKHILQQIKQGYSDNNYTFHKYQKRHHPNEQFNNFASSSSSSSSSSLSSSSSSSLLSLSLLSENENCGGYKTDPYGVIQTPKFPNKFNVPITCVWIIDASELASGPNISIVIYLTQLYVLGGLKFTEYMYYSDDYKVPSHRIFELTEDDVTQVAWIQFTSPYLEIKFTMKTLDGTHLRVLDKFLDVYGFNITYEVDTIKSYQCNALKCRFLGNCYARKDFTSYYCSCFPGYNGIDCGNGPLCADPEINVCENGGTCKHIGDTAVTCLCPPGFKGNKCEMPEIDELTGCVLQNVSDELHCMQQCKFSFSKYENNNNVNNLSCKNKCNSIFTSNITLQKSKITSPVTSTITTALTSSSSSSSESMVANNNSNGTVLSASLPVNSTSSSSFSSSSSSSSSSGSSRGERFHQKDSSYSNRSNKMHYEITIRLGTNLTQLYRQPDSFDRRSNEHLFNLLEKHMGRILRNSNITKVNDLEIISNFSNKLEITFHFMGIKSDSNRIRDTITRLVERGRLGNFTIVSDFLHFDEIPLLQIKSLVINQASPIRENSEFIISCVAKGSSKMEFFWYKDGVTVNESKATRDMWTMRLTSEQKHVYTSILGIHKSNLLDEGIYTCKVVDWDIEQCRSIIIRVHSPPQLRVDPSSITMYRGDSIRVRCLSAGNDQQRYGKLGYSWTKNGELFQSDPNSVMWEDLYPDGSILKIQNIQKSAEFTCVVSNSIAPVSKNVHITVIDRGIIELCPKEILFDIQWPASAPGIPIISDCPKQYKGHSKRMCEQRDIKKSVWLTPDFSECISNEMINIYNEFRALTLGYQRTNCSVILKSCLEYTKKRYTKFFPGEAGFLMDLLQEIENYLKLKGAHLEREMAAEIILHILDKVMQNVYSLNSQQQIKKLQQLTESAALNRETIAASQLAISTSSSSSSTSAGSSSSSSSSSLTSKKLTAGTSISDASSVTSAKIPLSPSSSASAAEDVTVLDVPGTESEIHHGDTSSGSMAITDSTPSLDRLNSFRIYTTTVRTLPFNLRLYGKDLFSDQLNMEIAHSKYLQNTLSNGTIFVSVISYKNLTSFLPKTYFTRGGDDLDADYSPASRIIATWLFQSNRSNDNFVLPLNLPLDAGHVEVIFQHESIPPNTDWTPVCGHELRASYEATWRTDLCITKNLMENLTKCICPLSGTFVVLFAKKTFDTSVYRNTARPMFVIISCGCCFLQSCIAFAFLIPILYNRKCCITFLKMQFCTSTSTVMAIFLLGFLKLLPQDWHGIISSTLASLMLLGLSTIVAIALIIQSELVPKKIQMTNLSTINNGIRGSIGISWLLPIIFSICSPLIYTIIGKWPISWWLEYDSSNFILFIIIESLFISLFILLFVILIKKLLYLAKKHDKHNSTICKRIGLLYRIAIVLFLKLATDSLFLVYHNTSNNLIISHIFGVCCVLLGFSILFCFVIKAEHNFQSKPLKKISTKTSVEEYCSGSINSPLSFYANHDIEKDNESGPPISQSPGCIIKSASGHHQQQQQQQRLPLTIISGPQCCGSTVLDRKIPPSSLKSSTEPTFCGCLGNETTIIGEKDGRICDISLNEMETTFTCKKLDSSVLSSHQNHPTSLTGGIPSSIIRACNCGNSTSNCGYKNRCCNLIIGSGSLETAKHQCQHHHHHHHHIHNQQQQQHQHQNDNWIEHHQLNDNISGPYDTTNYYQGTNTNINNKINYPTSEKHEFVGVETLDILQGVSPDSILGIRTSNILKTSSGSLKKDIENLNSCSVDTSVSKASVTTQTPKSQKRVTIVEEPKKTILLPLSSSSSSSLVPQSVILATSEASVGSGGAAHLIKHQSKIPISLSPPIIMITSSSGDNETNLIGCGVTNFSSSISNTTTTITTVTTTTSSSSIGTNIKPNKVGGNNNDNNSSNNNTENSFGTDDNDTTESVKTDPIDGMLDRISHDLDYLLNRTNEVPTRRVTVAATATTASAEICDNSGINDSDCNNTTIDSGTRGYSNSTSNPSNINDTINCSHILKQSDIAVVLPHQNDVNTSSILPPPPPPASMPPSIITSVPIPPSLPPSLSSSSSSSTHCRSVHEVIIEESEQE